MNSLCYIIIFLFVFGYRILLFLILFRDKRFVVYWCDVCSHCTLFWCLWRQTEWCHFSSISLFDILFLGQMQPWPSEDYTQCFDEGVLFNWSCILFYIFNVSCILFWFLWWCQFLYLLGVLITSACRLLQREEKQGDVMDNEVSLQRIQMEYKVCLCDPFASYFIFYLNAINSFHYF